MRAAVFLEAGLSRVARRVLSPRVALQLPLCPQRAFASRGHGSAGDVEGRWGRERDSRIKDRRSRAELEEEEPDDAEEEEELLRGDPLMPAGTQRVCLIHPEVKRGSREPHLTRGDGVGGATRAIANGRKVNGALGRGFSGCNQWT